MNNFNFDEAKKALAEKGVFESFTTGTSMKPLFKTHRDIITVKPLDRPIKKNDVVLYKSERNEKLILHRVIKVNKDGSLVIRGDNTYNNETDVKPEDIVGVLVSFYRNGKFTDCNKSKKYKAYVLYVRANYPFRYAWKIKIRPFLGRTKRKIFK